jgi:hypothetical protein
MNWYSQRGISALTGISRSAIAKYVAQETDPLGDLYPYAARTTKGQWLFNETSIAVFLRLREDGLALRGRV